MINKTKRNITIAVLLLVTVGFPLLILIPRGTKIDKIPDHTDALKPNYSKSAVIINGEDLFQKIGSFEAYDSLREDLYIFGKLSYKPYTTASTEAVGFKINLKSIKREGTKLTFDGKFGSSKNKIAVNVDILKNKKIKVSIEDTKTKINHDKDLTSNTPLNQFIGTLSLTFDNFSVSYSLIDSKIVVKLRDSSENTKKSALDFFKTKLDPKLINDNFINIYYPKIIGVAPDEKTEWAQTYIGLDY